MEYINHINKYDNSAAIQAALDAGTLVNPYVAMTSAGTLDFNSLQPTPPAPATMGTWTSSYGDYTLSLTEVGDQYWANPICIAKLNGVWQEGTQMNMDITLKKDTSESSSPWHIEFYADGLSEIPSYDFDPENSGSWDSPITTDDESGMYIRVYYSPTSSITAEFLFTANGFTIPITTINPEYPEAGE